MDKNVTDKEALQALEHVKSAQLKIAKRSTKEYLPWILWGLYFVLFYPPFDYIRPELWGTFCAVGAIVIGFITFWYVRKLHTGVKTIYKTPRYGIAIFGLWIIAGIVFASATQSHFNFAWTVAGLAIGLPFVAYGLKLKSRA